MEKAKNLNIREFIDKIAVVVVLYRTNLYETDAYKSLNASLQKFDSTVSLTYYVYDNSPTTDVNDEERLKKDGIYYKYNSSNPGLSKPSNDGAQLAKANGKEWILFTNPDTYYDLSYFEKLHNAIVENPEIELFAPVLMSGNNIVSPAKYNFFIGSSPESVTPGINNLEKKLILYSGMLVSTTAFYNSGGFNNKIKLDFMDCYFSENYRRAYSVFYLLDIKCKHDLSSTETNVNKVLTRFTYYCEGAKFFAVSKLNYITLFFICLLRSVKLSFRFRNFKFPIIVFKVFSTR